MGHKHHLFSLITHLLTCCVSWMICTSANAGDTTLIHRATIRGGLSPKSIVHNGHGLFFAQNMMYNHTIAVYDHEYQLKKSISDRVELSQYGIPDRKGLYRGAPVECAFSSDGKYAFVSNYIMEGDGFVKPGCDTCFGKDYDISYIYKINTSSLQIESVIPAGSVPKFLAVSPDNKRLLVSNWSSGDVTLIDLESEKEIKRFHCGKFPRGIAIDSKSKYAYVAVMGGTSIYRLDLESLSQERFIDIGKAPRHLCISSNDSLLYVTLNNEGNLAEIDLRSRTVRKLHVGGTPRSMTIGEKDKFLYVVNYSTSSFTKVDLDQFKVVEKVNTGRNPIGITYDAHKNEVWVACYSGSLMVYKDLAAPKEDPTLADFFNFGPIVEDFYNGIERIFPGTKSTGTNPPLLAETDLKEFAKKSSNEKPSNSLAKESTLKPKETTPKTPATPEKNNIPALENNGNFFVIVGSFKNPDNAKRQAENMKRLGKKCTVIQNSNGLHYAAIGGYADKASAGQMMDELRTKDQIEGWVWERK